MNRNNHVSRAILLSSFLFAVAAAMPFASAGPVMPADVPGTGPGDTVIVSVETFRTAVDGATLPSGSLLFSLEEGKPGVAYVASGFFDQNGEIGSRLAMGGVGQLDTALRNPFSVLPDRYPTVWGIRCTLVGREADVVTLGVEWLRREQQKSDSLPQETRGQRTIALAEEGHHLLDFIGTPTGEPDSAGLVNRTVVLGVRVAETPSLAALAIQYDLWLVDDAADGERLSQPLRLIGRQGEKLDFEFEDLRRTVPGLELDDGGAVQTLMEITGDIRGRIQPDGSIGITLNSGRRFGMAAAGEDATGWSGNGRGKKHFTAAPGETVSTLYPEPAGQSILYRQTESRPSVPGVTVTDEFIKVRFKPFFEGHAISLVLRAGTAR